MVRRLFRALIFGIMASLVAVPALATTVIALDLETLSRRASLIVVATPLSARAEPARAMIVTRVVLRIERVVAGRAPLGDELDLLIPGGEYGGVGVRVAGAPRLSPGRRYLLFLQHRGAVWTVLGMSQGALPIEVDAEGREQVMPAEGLPRLVTPTGGGLEPAAAALVGPRPLAQVVAAIREARDGR